MQRYELKFPALLIGLRETVAALGIVAFLFLLHERSFAEDNAKNISPQAMLRVANPSNQNGALTGVYESETYRKTQAALLKSRAVLVGALHEEGILDLPIFKDHADQPARWLEDHVVVTAPVGTEVLMVKLDDQSADGVKIVNAVVDSYLKNIVNVERRQQLVEHDLLEAKLRETQADAAQKRAQLQKLTIARGDTDLARQRYANLYRLLTDVRLRRIDLDLQLAAAKQRLTSAEANTPDAAKAKLDVGVAEAQIEVVQKARAELNTELDEAATAVNNSQSPEAGALVNDIKTLDSLIAELKSRRDQIVLELQLPPRVTLIEKATGQ